jgi:hypothetical protein
MLVLPGVGHAAMVGDPPLVAQTISRFTARDSGLEARTSI